ncbi:30S ribosomal protein S3 [Enterobacteriaceae bacterium ET-AT1-13]|uniref:Small ribosomal subunit protein uS3c n=2 Tax=Cacopsylla melanoneura TaxID=428564 RepID=A0A8D8PXZ5_9HEMI|nr:30S ribosomal protein S3 [Enterobacteriaceae bacterium ET-AT1-13]WGS66334.1 30S ribosomal protein S3 [Enterobacteriaceae bacterium Cmel17]WMC17357.1 MAG: 30S ribosomal protein S3 [Enterobacteriaceae bacterium Cmel21]WMC17564.1 MAG: 30S ribosomal protein S3 [Enterobacteriaceae bacterium PSmelAO3-2]WMC17769.1 MAG: 30S ribosomal protein S3 [Enterobacteriaceae bacterium PSmelAO3-1]WMC17972.1 MAG: 30S ribosomal protein S3 [Enterobacteriaceae bacterium PSmelAO1]
MGQKVNPHGVRLGIIKFWNSIWYANKKEYNKNLNDDFKIRSFLKKKLMKLFLSKIVIYRNIKLIKIIIYTSRSDSIIKNKNDNIEILCKEISKFVNIPSIINIFEIKKPEIDAKLISNNIKFQLEHRIIFRRIIKKSVQNAINNGAIGIKIELNGRIGGVEIARTEWHREGRVPLHTLRADIDYNTSIANTTYGVIGIKVWVFKGEILDNKWFFKKKIYEIINSNNDDNDDNND